MLFWDLLSIQVANTSINMYLITLQSVYARHLNRAWLFYKFSKVN